MSLPVTACKDFSGVIQLNNTGAVLWQGLEKGASKADLVALLMEKYEVTKPQAEKDVSLFLDKIIDAGFVENEA